mgnify:CR=1 FL=1
MLMRILLLLPFKTMFKPQQNMHPPADDAHALPVTVKLLSVNLILSEGEEPTKTCTSPADNTHALPVAVKLQDGKHLKVHWLAMDVQVHTLCPANGKGRQEHKLM